MAMFNQRVIWESRRNIWVWKMKLSHWTWRFNQSTLQFTMICSAETHTQPMKKHIQTPWFHKKTHIYTYLCTSGGFIQLLLEPPSWHCETYLYFWSIKKIVVKWCYHLFPCGQRFFSPPWFGEIAIHIWLISLFWLNLKIFGGAIPHDFVNFPWSNQNLCWSNPKCLPH